MNLTLGYGFAIMLLLSCSTVSAENNLGDWRSSVAAVRLLAESNAHAAYNEGQQLQAHMPQTASFADQARLLNLLSRIENYLALSEQAARHASQALDLANQHADRVGQAEADLNMALSAINQGNINQMLEAVTHSMTVLEGVDRPDLLGESMLLASMMYRRQGFIEDSIEMAMHNLEIAQLHKDTVGLIHAHHGVGIAYSQGDHLQLAQDHFRQMRDLAQAAHMRRKEAEADIELGRTFSLLADWPGSADHYFRDAIEISRQIDDPFGLALGLIALAHNMQQQYRFTEAQPLLDEAIMIHESHRNKIGLWWSLNYRSNNFQQLMQLEAAQADAERAYDLAKDISFSLYLSESARRLANVAAQRGQHQRAYRMLLEADELVAKSEHEKSADRVMALAERYETESKLRHVDELNRLNERQSAQLQQQALHQRWLLTLVASSLVVLFILGYFLQRQRKSSRQLQQLQSHQQAILNALPDWLFEVGQDGRYYECHSARVDLLAMSIDDFVGKTIADTLPTEAAAICLEALQEAGEHGISTGKQFWLPLPEGLGWFEISVARKFIWEAEPRFVVLVRDISERKQMEERLQASEQGFRTLAENSPGMIVRYDRNCRRLYVNPAYERETGIPKDLAKSKRLNETWRALIPVEEYITRLNMVMETGMADRILLEWLSADGSLLSHDIHAVAEYHADGLVTGVLVMGHNITELKMTERRLEESQHQLRVLTAKREEAREEERKRIAREIHDELGQLLNVLRLNVTTLDFRFGEANADLRKRIHKMVNTVDRAILMVRQLATRLRPAVLSSGIVSALDWLVHEFADSTGITTELHHSGQDIDLNEDRAMVVFRIVQESLTNILRHSGATHVDVVLRSGAGMLELEVCDNGKGFDKALPCREDAYGIVGMQERALILKGTLEIVSAQSAGTVLSLRLPLQEPQTTPVY